MLCLDDHFNKANYNQLNLLPNTILFDMEEHLKKSCDLIYPAHQILTFVSVLKTKFDDIVLYRYKN